MPVSVLILTLNEEIDIGDCLKSVDWSDDIVVLDSLSSDRTVEIARARGARVIERAFDDSATHQNWAMQNIEFRHPWVLNIDADERCSEELRDEILQRAQPDAPQAAFRMRRKDFYMGRWLRHAQIYPTWLVRLFRPRHIRFERLINSVAVVEGSIGELRGHILHYPFSKGVSHWIARHNRYSDAEAVEELKLKAHGPVPLSGLWADDPNSRRRVLKDIFFQLPARPLVKFVYYFFWRGAFLDGRPGVTYATLMTIYEYLIECKRRELQYKERGLPL